MATSRVLTIKICMDKIHDDVLAALSETPATVDVSDINNELAKAEARVDEARETLAMLVEALDDGPRSITGKDSGGNLDWKGSFHAQIERARAFLADAAPAQSAPRFEEPHPLERIGALRHAIDLIELAHGDEPEDLEVASTLNTLRELVDATEIKTEAPAPGWGQMLDAEITLTTAHGLPQRMTFRDFLDASEPFEESELRDMRAALLERRVYRGGGGASPEWTIEIA